MRLVLRDSPEGAPAQPPAEATSPPCWQGTLRVTGTWGEVTLCPEALLEPEVAVSLDHLMHQRGLQGVWSQVPSALAEALLARVPGWTLGGAPARPGSVPDGVRVARSHPVPYLIRFGET